MLSQLRNSVKNIIVTILFGLLVISFAVWGIGDIFRGAVATDVAKVGSRYISASVFEQQFRNQVRSLAEQTGGVFDTATAREIGLDRQVLATLINRAALAQEASRLGLTVSDQMLSRTIRENPNFRGPLGDFSLETMREILSLNQLTEDAYLTGLREDMATQQLIDAITTGSRVPHKMAEAIYLFANERRAIEYLVLVPDMAGPIEEPSDGEIEAFYRENPDQFTAPEFRRFTFLLVEAGDLKDDVVIEDEEIKEIYEFDKQRFDEPERRTVQIVSFLTEEDAKAAKTQLDGGLSFEDLLRNRNLTVEQVTTENATQPEFLDATVANAAFQMEVNKISAPVNGDLGWALARVSSITPGKQSAFEEAAATIRDELAGERARDLLNDYYARADDEISGGASIEEAAERLGTKAVTIVAADAQGKAPNGQPAPGLRDDVPAIFEEAFRASMDDDSVVLDSGTDGFFALRVDAVTPSGIKPLDSIRANVKTAVMTEKRKEKLTRLARSIIDRATAGTPFKDIAAEYGRSVLRSASPLARDSVDETLSQTVLAKLFAAEPNTFVEGTVGFGESHVVAVAREVVRPDPVKEAANIANWQQELEQMVAEDLASEYLRGLHDELGVTTYPTVIETALGGA